MIWVCLKIHGENGIVKIYKTWDGMGCLEVADDFGLAV
jgi:hypothetical protein